LLRRVICLSLWSLETLVFEPSETPCRLLAQQASQNQYLRFSRPL
jgi:hypothetical protein